jgi:two-component system sensor histidine kinase/response regulator
VKYRILVVEDNPANRELLCDWLEATGFEVQAAENLEQAFSTLERQQPHAVLLDVQLGREDGLVFASRVRREGKFRQIPIIAVTAHAMIADHERVIQAGCNACISKPIDFKLLSKQLEQWLDCTTNLQPRS